MTRSLFVAIWACALSLATFVGTSSATMLAQTNPNGLAFHGSLTTNLSGIYHVFNSGTDIGGTIYSPPNPGFNGSVMWMAGPTVGTDLVDNDTVTTDGVNSFAEYTVRFTTQGTYRVFVSGQRTGTPQQFAEGASTGNNDSLFVGGIDQDHTATANWTQLTLAQGTMSYRSTNSLWVIDGITVDQDLTLTVGLREDGPMYDRVAFVLEGSGISPNDLVAIPEPASLSLALALAAAGCGLVFVRRSA